MRNHLIAIGAWSEEEHTRMHKAMEDEVIAAQKEAESYGTLASGHVHDASTMFDDTGPDLNNRYSVPAHSFQCSFLYLS